LSVFDLFYAIAILFFSPILSFKILFDRDFRKNFTIRLFPDVSNYKDATALPANTIWVHAASIGEIRLAIKLIHAWLQTDENRQFFITTNTIQSKTLGEKETTVPVLVAPLDLSFIVKKFIRLTNPQHLVLIETEIWPNMVRLMAKTGQITIVNARLSDRYYNRYLIGKQLFARTISHLDWILARDQVSAQRFKKLGVPENRILSQGNLKYEIPHPPDKNSLISLRTDFLSLKTSFLFVAGSLQADELEYILPAWKKLQKEVSGFQMVLIPRHPGKKDDFARVLVQSGINFSFSSELDSAHTTEQKNHILLIDQMGVLKSWYFLADAVFVGGSLCNRGGQNMVEAVGYHKPVCIGPYAINFKDEVDLLLGVGGLEIVHDSEELYAFIQMCHNSPEAAAQMGDSGYQAIAEQAHALDANISKLSEIYTS